ncbi:hypothetical protein P7C73_g1245, partial [Tremellales sp. Uapishka_1]
MSSPAQDLFVSLMHTPKSSNTWSSPPPSTAPTSVDVDLSSHDGPSNSPSSLSSSVFIIAHKSAEKDRKRVFEILGKEISTEARVARYKSHKGETFLVDLSNTCSSPEQSISMASLQLPPAYSPVTPLSTNGVVTPRTPVRPPPFKYPTHATAFSPYPSPCVEMESPIRLKCRTGHVRERSRLEVYAAGGGKMDDIQSLPLSG